MVMLVALVCSFVVSEKKPYYVLFKHNENILVLKQIDRQWKVDSLQQAEIEELMKQTKTWQRPIFVQVG